LNQHLLRQAFWSAFGFPTLIEVTAGPILNDHLVTTTRLMILVLLF